MLIYAASNTSHHVLAKLASGASMSPATVALVRLNTTSASPTMFCTGFYEIEECNQLGDTDYARISIGSSQFGLPPSCPPDWSLIARVSAWKDCIKWCQCLDATPSGYRWFFALVVDNDYIWQLRPVPANPSIPYVCFGSDVIVGRPCDGDYEIGITGGGSGGTPLCPGDKEILSFVLDGSATVLSLWAGYRTLGSPDTYTPVVQVPADIEYCSDSGEIVFREETQKVCSEINTLNDAVSGGDISGMFIMVDNEPWFFWPATFPTVNPSACDCPYYAFRYNTTTFARITYGPTNALRGVGPGFCFTADKRCGVSL